MRLPANRNRPMLTVLSPFPGRLIHIMMCDSTQKYFEIPISSYHRERWAAQGAMAAPPCGAPSSWPAGAWSCGTSCRSAATASASASSSLPTSSSPAIRWRTLRRGGRVARLRLPPAAAACSSASAPSASPTPTPTPPPLSWPGGSWGATNLPPSPSSPPLRRRLDAGCLGPGVASAWLCNSTRLHTPFPRRTNTSLCWHSVLRKLPTLTFTPGAYHDCRSAVMPRMLRPWRPARNRMARTVRQRFMPPHRPLVAPRGARVSPCGAKCAAGGGAAAVEARWAPRPAW